MEDCYFCILLIRIVLRKLKKDSRAKGLIFDLDGTIADTMPIHFIAYRNILREYGVNFTPEVFATLAGIPAIGTIARINEMYGTNLDPEIFGRLKEDEYERNMVKMKPVGPVVDLIKENNGRLPMAVGTGGYKRLAWKTMEILGLKPYITILVSSEDVKNHKPHPDTFLKCAELMGVEPQYCQVFEDGKLGMEAALKAGMMAVDVTEFYEVTIGKEV
jgi:beta-phosphoglucomutase family hydrolase